MQSLISNNCSLSATNKYTRDRETGTDRWMHENGWSQEGREIQTLWTDVT